MLEFNAGVDTLDTNSEVSPIVYNSTAAALTTAAYNTTDDTIYYDVAVSYAGVWWGTSWIWCQYRSINCTIVSVLICLCVCFMVKYTSYGVV